MLVYEVSRSRNKERKKSNKTVHMPQQCNNNLDFIIYLY